LVFQVVESFRCLSFRDARETFGVHNRIYSEVFKVNA
jgi:hypothetical protein